jgi:hypothetical protein
MSYYYATLTGSGRLETFVRFKALFNIPSMISAEDPPLVALPPLVAVSFVVFLVVCRVEIGSDNIAFIALSACVV